MGIDLAIEETRIDGAPIDCRQRLERLVSTSIVLGREGLSHPGATFRGARRKTWAIRLSFDEFRMRFNGPMPALLQPTSAASPCVSTRRQRAAGLLCRSPILHLGLWVCGLLLEGSVAFPSAGQEVATWNADQEGYGQQIAPFLEEHCVRCHGSETTEADLDVLQHLTADLTDRVVKSRWAEAVNALHGHTMPPESEQQPDPEDVARVVDWVTAEAQRAVRIQRDQGVVLRRLNRDEYRRTIRELTGVEPDVSLLPLDPAAGGFDNNGSALTLSPLHLESYYEIAKRVLDEALVTGEQPPVIQGHFEVESGDSDANRVDFLGQRPIVNGGVNRVEGDFKVLHHESWDRGLDVRDFRLPHAGEYVIRLRAGARIPDRQEVIAAAEKYLAERRDRELAERPEGAKWIQQQYEQDLNHFRTDRMYDYGPPRLKITRTLGGQPKVVAEFDVRGTIEEPEIHEFRVAMTTESAGIKIDYAYSIPKVLENFWMQTGDDFARPEAWVDWIEIEGPVYDSWPPRGTQQILSESLDWRNLDGADEEQAARRILQSFLRRALRRPPSDSEVDAKVTRFLAQRAAGESFVEALRDPLMTTLVSPSFLYRVETGEEGTVAADRGTTQKAIPLTPHELACRLSYFLWGSMPDETLFRLADNGSLTGPEVLTAQVDRMLQDARSDAFIENFAGQWLGLREVGANPPAADLYPHYDRHLEVSMVQESRAFFAEVLRQNHPLSTLVSSDFVVINERLARYYGIDGVRGDDFRVVPVPDGVHRGGVMTQASILTITSNGTRTSPVKRGVWMLKTLWGMDPGLPVAGVGEIAPSVPGIDRATVRKRLEIHRTLPQCARCHSKIDPLGFALENFDAAGAWREQEGFGYKGRVQSDDPQIDADSRLPDGTEIVGVDGLRDALMDRRELFHRAFAERMLTYALGRELGLSDRATIDSAVAHLSQPHQDSIAELMRYVVLSESFRTK